MLTLYLSMLPICKLPTLQTPSMSVCLSAYYLFKPFHPPCLHGILSHFNTMLVPAFNYLVSYSMSNTVNFTSVVHSIIRLRRSTHSGGSPHSHTLHSNGWWLYFEINPIINCKFSHSGSLPHAYWLYSHAYYFSHYIQILGAVVV